MKKWTKNTLNIVLQFIMDTLKFTIYILKLINQNSFKNKLCQEYTGIAAVLANGPSLNEELPRLSDAEEFQGVDFIVLNLFAFEEIFFRIRPKHYCLADPMFFKNSHRIESVLKLYDILENRVNWDLNIYIPAERYKDFISFSGILNEKLKIVKINMIDFNGYNNLRNYFYRKNLSTPHVQNISNLAIYVAINLGYTEVRLYGVDHTFFDISVNEQNQLCYMESHFYDKKQPVLKPIKNNETDQLMKTSEYLNAILKMFQSHDLLENYAKYRNVKIFNFTKCSMIDSYERKKTI